MEKQGGKKEARLKKKVENEANQKEPLKSNERVS